MNLNHPLLTSKDFTKTGIFGVSSSFFFSNKFKVFKEPQLKRSIKNANEI